MSQSIPSTPLTPATQTPINIADLPEFDTPLIRAIGGRLVKTNVETTASQVKMRDGNDAETRINTIERALAANTTTYFADDIAGRDQLIGLITGDRVYCMDASADPTVAQGNGAMYILLPTRQFHKLYEGDAPIDPLNLIAEDGGLAPDDQDENKLKVDLTKVAPSRLKNISGPLASSEGGMGVDANTGKLKIDLDSIGTDQRTKIFDGLAQAGGGLNKDTDGRAYVDYGTLTLDYILPLISQMIVAGNGVILDANDKFKVKWDEITPALLQAAIDPYLDAKAAATAVAGLQSEVIKTTDRITKLQLQLEELKAWAALNGYQST